MKQTVAYQKLDCREKKINTITNFIFWSINKRRNGSIYKQQQLILFRITKLFMKQNNVLYCTNTHKKLKINLINLLKNIKTHTQ